MPSGRKQGGRQKWETIMMSARRPILCGNAKADRRGAVWSIVARYGEDRGRQRRAAG
jgi:hypothetical protein